MDIQKLEIEGFEKEFLKLINTYGENLFSVSELTILNKRKKRCQDAKS